MLISNETPQKKNIDSVIDSPFTFELIKQTGKQKQFECAFCYNKYSAGNIYFKFSKQLSVLQQRVRFVKIKRFNLWIKN